MNQKRAKSATLALEAEFGELVRSGQLTLGPFSFTSESSYQGPADGVLRVRLQGSKLTRRFVFECKANWTRRTRAEAIERLRKESGDELLPMVIAPYLSERTLDELREQGISALDLSGNGLLIDLPTLFVLRTGAKKRARVSPPSRLAIYDSRNVATLIPRIFLSQPSFPTTTAVLEACHSRMLPTGGASLPLTLPTVSKALRELDEDLVTERRGKQRVLRDPRRLLELLLRGFKLPHETTLSFKTKLSPEEIWTRLWSQRPTLRFVTTGRGSAPRHAGLSGPARLQLYVSDVHTVAQTLDAKPTQAFPNLELTQTSDEAPYFDAREFDGVLWSSPLQCFLELARVVGDPRERDVAEALRVKLLDKISTPGSR